MKANGITHQVDVCGIDALNVPGGGIELVKKGTLTASYIYPTKGDKLLELAMNILRGKSYSKHTMLQSELVTPANAQVIQMQYDEIADRQHQLKQLNGKIDNYLSQLSLQRMALVLSAGLLLLAVVVIIFQRRIVRLRKSQSAMSALYSTDISRAAIAAEEHTEVENRIHITSPMPLHNESESFATRLREVVQAHLCDSDMDVDMIAQKLGMSRTALYRKVKALTGQSVVELIRESRLKLAHTMLAQGHLSVSEVAYAVGFSSPAYFTKCYKDFFGHTPKNIKNQS